MGEFMWGLAWEMGTQMCTRRCYGSLNYALLIILILIILQLPTRGKDPF